MMIRRFVEKRGYNTSYYSMTFGGEGPDFVVYKNDIRIGIVEVKDHKIRFCPHLLQSHYEYNIYDPDSLPLLVEQIKAIWIDLGGCKWLES